MNVAKSVRMSNLIVEARKNACKSACKGMRKGRKGVKVEVVVNRSILTQSVNTHSAVRGASSTTSMIVTRNNNVKVVAPRDISKRKRSREVVGEMN